MLIIQPLNRELTLVPFFWISSWRNSTKCELVSMMNDKEKELKFISSGPRQRPQSQSPKSQNSPLIPCNA